MQTQESTQLWDKKNIPHKGWELIEVIDVEEEGEDRFNCMMCGKQDIRFKHLIQHSQLNIILEVGCTCAEHLTEDYVNPKKMETKARNKSAAVKRRKKKFFETNWRQTENNNYWAVFETYKLFIYKKQNVYKCKINEIWGKKTFNTFEEAIKACYDGILFLENV